MKTRLAELVAALRRGGVAVSVAEAIDAAAALGVAGVDRAVLRDALAATLVKREEDRALYDDVFERLFPARVAAPAGSGRRRRSPASGGATDAETPGAAGGSGRGHSSSRGAVRDDPEQPSRALPRRDAEPVSSPPRPDGVANAAEDGLRASFADERTPGPSVQASSPGTGMPRTTAVRAGADPADQRGVSEYGAERLARRARERALLATPFRAMSPRDVDEASALVRALARRFRGRLSRRLRHRTRGRLDFRRTIRAAIARGGVPIDRRFRARRPRKLALVALCDLSASTATATDFFLTLLAPATDYFTRVRLFGFVDRLVEIEFAGGHVRPAGPIDLMARSDFGRVLQDLAAGRADELTADTLLLVLGDARNNRRPPRADLLAAARGRVRRLLWLDPEPVERWNTGDSVIATYARHADAVVPCGSLAELDRAIATICRA